MIIDAFENRLFPMSNGNYYQRRDPGGEDTSDSGDGNNDNDGNNVTDGNNDGNDDGNDDGDNGNNDGSNDGNNGNNGNNGNDGNDGNHNGNNKSQMISKKITTPTSRDSNTIYKYFFEKSLTDIENKLRIYKKDPKTKKLFNGMVKRLTIGLENLIKDKKKLSKGEDKFLLDLIEKTVGSLINSISDIPEEKIEIQYTPPRYFKIEGNNDA